MLKAEITIKRSPEVVWDYFTKTRNWEKWWGGGLKSAQWRKGGKLEWASGGSSPIQAITPGKMVQTVGSWADTTFTFEPKESGKTIVRIQESSPKGGASFSDGGAAHLASLNSYLNKLKEHIESETKQDVESEGKQARVEDTSTAKYICPHCGSELQGIALTMVEMNMQKGVVDFQTNCSSCGRAITKRDIESSSKKSVKQSTTEKKPVASPTKKWWEFWK